MNDLRRGSYLILFVLMLAGHSLPAQNPYIQHYTTSEGLPSNNVYEIYQDSRKFIWFATDGGVARYDGAKFVYYRKQNGLSSNDIFDVMEDSFGRVWFFNINASFNFFYDNTIYNEKNAPFLDSLKNSDFSRKLYEDENKNLYFYENPQRLIFVLNTRNQVTKHVLPSIPVRNDITPITMEGMSIRYLNIDKKGEFTFWTPSGCYRTKNLSEKPSMFNNEFRFKDVIFSSNNNKYIIVRSKNTHQFELKKFNGEILFNNSAPLFDVHSEYISSVLEDKSGILWISTYDKGVYCIKNNKIIYHFDIKDAKSVIQDHENNIWISSLKEGVYKISPFFTYHQHFENQTFQNSGIFALCHNDSSGVWCTNGRLIYLLKKNELYSLNFQNSENSFNQILQVDPHTLLVGETSKRPFALEGIRLNAMTKKVYVERVSQSAYLFKKITYNERKDEISTYNQFFLYFIHPKKLFSDFKTIRTGERIYNTFYNNNNDLVLNAKKNYIYQNDTIKLCEELSAFNNKIITDHLNLDKKNEIFNIEGDTLFLFNNKRLYNLSAAFEQSIDLQIKYLAFQDSTLFIATPRNVYVCKNPLNILQGKAVRVHLVNVNFESVHDILFDDNKLYVASDDGLTVIPYNDLYSNDTYSPIPYFQSVQINDQEKSVGQNQLSLISNQRINISFSSINYSISPIIFSYKLEGSDSDWTTVKGSNVVLQNLPIGKYLFKLRARKPTSPWSEPIELGIKIEATLWQHPVFQIFVVLLLVGVIFLVILRQKNMELKRRQMEHQLILLEQKSLQAMMNPHFIFNALGSIQNYLLRNKPNEAGIYLSQFARLIRQNLNAINAALISLEEEVDRLKNYLDLEKMRMENKFDYRIEIDDSIEYEDILIPSMVIQPFVENAVWHGIANLDETGFISVIFKFHNPKSLLVVVEDTGVGIDNTLNAGSGNKHHLKIGMAITRKRLKLLSQKYGIETSITYSEKTPGGKHPGTCATIVVPFFFKDSERQSEAAEN